MSDIAPINPQVQSLQAQNAALQADLTKALAKPQELIVQGKAERKSLPVRIAAAIPGPTLKYGLALLIGGFAGSVGTAAATGNLHALAGYYIGVGAVLAVVLTAAVVGTAVYKYNSWANKTKAADALPKAKALVGMQAKADDAEAARLAAERNAPSPGAIVYQA